MSHSSKEGFYDESIMKSLIQSQEKADSTYPDGKLKDNDEGGIYAGIAIDKGRIIIQFAKPVSWIGFTKDEAMNFAMEIISKVKDVHRS